MNRYVILWKFTEKGIANVQQSPERAEAFVAAARKLGSQLDFCHF